MILHTVVDSASSLRACIEMTKRASASVDEIIKRIFHSSKIGVSRPRQYTHTREWQCRQTNGFVGDLLPSRLVQREHPKARRECPLTGSQFEYATACSWPSRDRR